MAGKPRLIASATLGKRRLTRFNRKKKGGEPWA